MNNETRDKAKKFISCYLTLRFIGDEASEDECDNEAEVILRHLEQICLGRRKNKDIEIAERTYIKTIVKALKAHFKRINVTKESLIMEKLACQHCGYSGENIKWQTEYVGGQGFVTLPYCEDRDACWERSDNQEFITPPERLRETE